MSEHDYRLYERLRNRGYSALGPGHTRTFMAVLEGITTLVEITRATGLSTSVTTSHLRRLQGLGLVYRDQTSARGKVKAIRPCYEMTWPLPLPDMAEIDRRAERAVALAAAEADETEQVITDPMELRRGDLLYVDVGPLSAYEVREVRQGAATPHMLTIRLSSPDNQHTWWHKVNVKDDVKAVRR